MENNIWQVHSESHAVGLNQLFLERDAFIRTNRCAIGIMFVFLSVWTGVHCDYTMRVCTDVSFNVLCTLTRKHVHLLPAVLFHFYLEEIEVGWVCKQGVISQEKLKIDV